MQCIFGVVVDSINWAYYQAKSIKGYLYETQKETLELEFKKNKANPAKPLNDEYEKKIALYLQKNYAALRRCINDELIKKPTKLGSAGFYL